MGNLCCCKLKKNNEKLSIEINTNQVTNNNTTNIIINNKNNNSIQLIIYDSNHTTSKIIRCKASKLKQNINPLYQVLCAKLECSKHYCYICGIDDSDHTFYNLSLIHI